ncbi:hypothetical protein [Winogradskyella sp.]|uniref:hypothetical protein n=1 Tax=Winogradskyella sp. TaxID=1883156 RepID=UPI002353F2DB|nr:hypothetical protein [Winogradskyella sp.]
MSQQQQKLAYKVGDMLNVNFQDEKSPWITSSKTLMKLIGVLGMLLPILIYTFLVTSAGHTEVLESISHYFYTRSNPIFIIVVSLMAIFLMIYKYKEPIDFYLSFFAGVAALCVLLFPTDSIVDACNGLCGGHTIAFLEDDKFRVGFHYVSAAVFLGILTYMCFFLFTRSDKMKPLRSTQKNKRNIIYIVCGCLMTLALVVIFLGFLKVIPDDVYRAHKLTFWMETLAVEAFGFSWLVKGEFILKDKS